MAARTVHMYWAFDISTFGQAMTTARLQHNMKMSELAELVGCSQSNWSRLERGMTHNPEMNTILAICDALDLDPRQYFEVRKLGE